MFKNAKTVARRSQSVLLVNPGGKGSFEPERVPGRLSLVSKSPSGIIF